MQCLLSKIMKTNFVLIFILISIGFVSSLEIGISPAHIELYGAKGQKLCENISVYSDRNINVLFESRWSKDDSRDINNYQIEPEEIGIEVYAPDKITLEKDMERNIEVCFEANKKGDFYGAVIFESENGYASVGSWVYIKINNEKGITGYSVSQNNANKLFIGGALLILFELLILLFLIFRKKKTKKAKF